jgi:hypothetical protein
MHSLLRKLNIPGNPYALARVVGILICLLAAAIIGFLGATPLGALFGSFFGAALSLMLNWVVLTLEKPDSENVPPEFVAAAARDLMKAGYHREKQIIRLRVIPGSSASEADQIELKFSATLRPNRASVIVYHQTIRPPAGTTLVFSRYRVGDASVAYEGYHTLEGVEDDELVIVYKMNGKDVEIDEDTHRWSCPVRDYSFQVEPSDDYFITVGKITGGPQWESLTSKPRKNFTEYISSGPSFTAQGLKWRLTRREST